jgi:1,4-dihydroxy-2-naphthoate octaprenyltransferase
MTPIEPHQSQFSSPWARYFFATRPAFLSVTLMGALIGLGSVRADGIEIDVLKACLSMFFGLVAHAGANVLNDYYDALNGSDAVNHQRLFPFTGGSRFIQNGVISLAKTRHFGYALLISVIPAGLWLAANSATGVILIGLTGLLIAWAYSAPPMQLMARGLGEVAIVAGWLMVVLGIDFVQRGSFAILPLIAGVPYALLVAAILYLNQFPDRLADAAADKRTLVVRLGTLRARWGYMALVLTAYLWLAFFILNRSLPWICAIGLLAAPLSLKACRDVLNHADHPVRLMPAIKSTIAAANFNGFLMAIALTLSPHI